MYQRALTVPATPDGRRVLRGSIRRASAGSEADEDLRTPIGRTAVEGSWGRARSGARPAHGVKEGDTILLGPDNRAARRGCARSGPFRVARIFRTNFYESDSELVFLERNVLRRLARMEGQANVVEIKLDTIRDTESAARAIGEAAGKEFSVTDWRSLNSGLFSALAIQQTTLYSSRMIVGVSTFNRRDLGMTFRRRSATRRLTALGDDDVLPVCSSARRLPAHGRRRRIAFGSSSAGS